jgi:hypothetical protein
MKKFKGLPARGKGPGMSYLVKTRSRGKEVLLATKPLVKEEAIYLGAKVSRGTARASFELVPIAGEARGGMFPRMTEAEARREFRYPIRGGRPTMEPLKFVQPSATRISSRGEIKEIPMVGAQVRRQKAISKSFSKSFSPSYKPSYSRGKISSSGMSFTLRGSRKGPLSLSRRRSQARTSRMFKPKYKRSRRMFI